MADFQKWEGAVLVPVASIELDPMNPNVMEEDTFGKLVDMIQEHGFDEPLQIARHPDKPDIFVCVGGEHRLKAAKVLGMVEVPCCIKDGLTDEDKRQMVLVQRNIVRGDLDQTKFSKLVAKLSDNGYDKEVIRTKMGFNNPKVFEKLLKEEKAKEEKVLEDDKEKEVHIVDNLQFVVNEILAQGGDTIPKGFVMFAYKNRIHMLVQCDGALYKLMQLTGKALARNNTQINEFMVEALTKAVAEKGWEQREFEADLTDNYEPTGPGEAPAEGAAPAS